MQLYMIMLQKYQFELRDCSLAKNYKSFKLIVATGSWLHLSLIANFGRWQGGLVTIAMSTGHISRNGRALSSNRCYWDQARLSATQSSTGRRDVGGPSLLRPAPLAIDPMLQQRVPSLVSHCSPKWKLLMLKILTLLKHHESTLEEIKGLYQLY
jgi:hypothetical protein